MTTTNRRVGSHLEELHRGNAATLAGWRVLRFGPPHIRSGEALAVIRAALATQEIAR